MRGAASLHQFHSHWLSRRLKLATSERSRGAHYFTKPVEIDEMVKTTRKELAAQNSSLDRGQEYDLRSGRVRRIKIEGQVPSRPYAMNGPPTIFPAFTSNSLRQLTQDTYWRSFVAAARAAMWTFWLTLQ